MTGENAASRLVVIFVLLSRFAAGNFTVSAPVLHVAAWIPNSWTLPPAFLLAAMENMTLCSCLNRCVAEPPCRMATFWHGAGYCQLYNARGNNSALVSTGSLGISSVTYEKVAKSGLFEWCSRDSDCSDSQLLHCSNNTCRYHETPIVENDMAEDTGDALNSHDTATTVIHTHMVVQNNARSIDCAGLQTMSLSEDSGVYTLRLTAELSRRRVLCDFSTSGGGWTVVQANNMTAVNSKATAFNEGRLGYREGFGRVSDTGDFWLGCDVLHALTASAKYSLRIEIGLADGSTKLHAHYGWFRVANASEDFSLEVSDYSGTAGDHLSASNGHCFRTGDHMFCRTYNPARFLHCILSKSIKGGWWFSPEDTVGNIYGYQHSDSFESGCSRTYLNSKDQKPSGLRWGDHWGLLWTRMMIRPAKFKSRHNIMFDML